MSQFQVVLVERIEIFLVRGIGGHHIAPQLHGKTANPLDFVNFLKSKISAPMKRCSLGISKGTWNTTNVTLCMRVQKVFDIRVKMKPVKLQQFFDVFVWFYRQILIANNTVKRMNIMNTCWNSLWWLELWLRKVSLPEGFWIFAFKPNCCFEIRNHIRANDGWVWTVRIHGAPVSMFSGLEDPSWISHQ